MGLLQRLLKTAFLLKESAETVSVFTGTHRPSQQIISCKDAKVLRIWSSSPDDFSPHSIDFVCDGVEYRLLGAHLLRNVTREYKSRRQEDTIMFTANLEIINNVRIVAVLPYTK
jgi:hypothetical protein